MFKVKKLMVLLLVMSMFLVSCGGEEKKDESVFKVAVIGAATGDTALYTISVKKGVEMALEDRDVIENMKMVGDYKDTNGQIEDSRNAALKAVQEKVDLMMGEAISATTIPIAEICYNSRIPMLVPNATRAEITAGKDNVFRISVTDPYQGQVMASYLKNKGETDAILLTNNSNDQSKEVSNAFKEEADKLGLNVHQESYSDNDKDLSAILKKVQSLNIKNVFIPDYYNKVGLMLRQAKTLKFDAQFLGIDAWDEIHKDFSKESEGSIYMSQFSLEDENPKVKEFIRKFKLKYPNEEPTMFTALGYDTITVAQDALERTLAGGQKYDKDRFVEEIRKTDLDLLTGHIKFGADGNPKKAIKFIQIQDGKPVVIQEESAGS